MKIGYARVSTDTQNLDLQLDALHGAGVDRVFEDHASGVAASRPGLTDALAALAEGDTLVVWRLDRLGRSLPYLIETVRQLGERGIGFTSLSDNVDTTTAGGRLIFHVMGALAEFERSLTIERVVAGMAAAKSRGRHLGRPPAMNPSRVANARLLLSNGIPAAEVARTLGIGRSTLFRALKASPVVVA